MARKPTSPQTSPPPRLLVPLNEARERLISRREQGVSLLNAQRSSVNNAQALETAQASYKKWSDYNIEMLRRIFDSAEYAEQYSGTGNYSISMFAIGGGRDVRREILDHFEHFQSKIEYIDSLADRLDLIELAPNVGLVPAISEKAAVQKSPNKVFIVHGQDNETKTIVARFVERCGLIPIILHEQPDQGRTIIEKFEDSADVAFAIVLLTPDDVGALKTTGPVDETLLKSRARQNVILELGYFIGRLGRPGVCALKKGDVELPSDFSGVVYTPYDGADEGWKIKLAREMRSAGLSVDLNAALG